MDVLYWQWASILLSVAVLIVSVGVIVSVQDITRKPQNILPDLYFQESVPPELLQFDFDTIQEASASVWLELADPNQDKTELVVMVDAQVEVSAIDILIGYDPQLISFAQPLTKDQVELYSDSLQLQQLYNDELEGGLYVSVLVDPHKVLDTRLLGIKVQKRSSTRARLLLHPASVYPFTTQFLNMDASPIPIKVGRDVLW